MFSSSRRLEANLKACLMSNPYNNYRILIKYKRFQDSIIKKISSYKGELINHIESCKIISARLNAKGIQRLLEYPEIEYICFDEYLFLCGISVNTANKVRLPNKNRNKGKGIGVAIIDSGVYPHQDLITPYNRISLFIDLINNLHYPYDDNGHGTCTAGIIAGNGKRSNGMYNGIAPESTIYCFKAFDKTGKGYFSDVLYAMQLVATEGEKGIVKVLCLPFELLGYNIFLQKLFDSMVSLINSKNITCIIPSGSNRNLDGSITGLALCNGCITVSGYDSTANIKPYTYSSTGSTRKDNKPNLCAACVDIISLNSDVNYISERDGNKLYPSKLDLSYKSFTGTSIAAAYIAGICALIYENDKNLTPKDISSILKVACEQLDDIPHNYQGDGKINIKLILK
ncbi:S8 family serine peptidase [Clostridium sp. AL.422]|uniref:S8 family serine peptidase n=1 Tax=Clostridium TaxID=1485 RepID=UPI00293DD7FC|nr:MULTISPECIES: S8 family serine peptidase [unclassified Clostridium]MDV4150791.1 S8 family serine peptidase [Clostridium sp. AL.422]